ncbi:ABC transporter permease [Paenibacillus algorifonticola]|uniref:ABC transporter permease n=1 Tax=Paenibacillus algorifonticola TaxID=684063 RepID=UPI003D287A91
MIRSIWLECYKLRRRYVGMTVLLMIGVEMGWAFMATSMSIARNPDQASWEPLIAMTASLNGLFAPILAAICVSRICDMEHKGNTWKLLLSMSVKRERLYAAKYGCVALILLLACIVQILALIAFGKMNGFEEAVPIMLLGRLLAGTMAAHLAVIALQQWLSMALKNQAFALCLGMLGGFIGMAADLFPSAIRPLFIWSYYSGLSPVAQSYTDNQLEFIARDLGAGLPMLGLLLFMGLLIYGAGRWHISRQEV